MKIVLLLFLIIILVFTLFLKSRIVETVENFDQNTPTPITLPIRVDGSCSDPNESAIYDRFDGAGMSLMGLSKNIPPNFRNDTLNDVIGIGTLDTLNMDFTQKCINDNSTYDKKGRKVFIDTGVKAKKPDGTFWEDYLGNSYNLVDIYCCKGEVYTPPDSSGGMPVCLANCPSNYSIPVGALDRTICFRDDRMCAYNSDLSANIVQNWLNTCANIYKKNLDTTTTISSIINVVSSFSTQTEMATIDFNRLNITVSTHPLTNNQGTSWSTIRTKYNSLRDLQTTINDKLNQLKVDKSKFDMMFNQFGCSNYMFS